MGRQGRGAKPSLRKEQVTPRVTSRISPSCSPLHPSHQSPRPVGPGSPVHTHSPPSRWCLVLSLPGPQWTVASDDFRLLPLKKMKDETSESKGSGPQAGWGLGDNSRVCGSFQVIPLDSRVLWTSFWISTLLVSNSPLQGAYGWF